MVKTSSETQTISGRVLREQPVYLIDYLDGIAAAMGLAVDLVTAPAAFIRAAPCSDEVDGTLLVMGTPRIHVALDVNCLPGGPRLRIQVGDLLAWWILLETAQVVEVGDAGDLRVPVAHGGA